MTLRVGSKVLKPWGFYTVLVHHQDYSVKLLHIKPGEATSLQRHSKRHEFVTLLEGSVVITHKDHIFTKDVSQQTSSYRIQALEWHRFAAPSDQKKHTVLLEVAYGELDPQDFERQEDNYQRTLGRGAGFIDK